MNKLCVVVTENPDQARKTIAVATFAWCVAHVAQFKRGM